MFKAPDYSLHCLGFVKVVKHFFKSLHVMSALGSKLCEIAREGIGKRLPLFNSRQESSFALVDERRLGQKPRLNRI